MRIVDESSNSGRQIVPEDMNYLSLADREVVKAMECIVKAMTGMAAKDAIVVSGCEVSWEPGTREEEGLYKIGDGVILWDGLLWDLQGIEVSGNATPMAQKIDLCIVFDRTRSVRPSPVYGMTLELDQNPHKNMTAKVAESNTVPKSAERIVLGMLKRVPKMGVARNDNDKISGTGTEGEKQ